MHVCVNNFGMSVTTAYVSLCVSCLVYVEALQNKETEVERKKMNEPVTLGRSFPPVLLSLGSSIYSFTWTGVR